MIKEMGLGVTFSVLNIVRAAFLLCVAMILADSALAEGPANWLEYMRSQAELEGSRTSTCELTEAVPGTGDRDCDRRVPERVQNIGIMSEILLNSGARYEFIGSGDGEDGLAGKPAASMGVNCTTSMELVTPQAWDGTYEDTVCRAEAPSRYFPGMENTYFGRGHFYETQWRANALNRGLAIDVTDCVTLPTRPSCSGRRGDSSFGYKFKVDRRDWDGLMDRHFGKLPVGRVFLSHWRDPAAAQTYVGAISNTNCAAAYELFMALRRDWPYAGSLRSGLDTSTNACADAASMRRLGIEYLSLLEQVTAQTGAGLSEHPIEATLPCVGFGRDKKAFDPERDFPAGWRKEGVALYVGLIRRDPKWTRNKLAVQHQGLVVFHGGRWVLRHASREKGTFVEVPFKEYVSQSDFVGMNLLAP